LRTQFAQVVRAFEEERQMTYITSIEEIGIEKGRIEGRIEGRIAGLIEGIAVMLDLKFGDAAQSTIAEIQAITNLNTLEQLIAHIKSAQTLDEIRQIYTLTTNST
jgi:predicted transposase YdaD